MEQSGSEVDVATAFLAAHVRALRDRNGWSAERLAEEMTKVGVPWGRLVVTKLENGKRQAVSVTEWLALAYVFQVSPMHLLIPLHDMEYPVTPKHMEGTRAVRSWIRGEHELDGMDARIFASYVPEHEFGRPVDWPETVTYERTEGDPERWTVDLGSRQELRLRRRPEWRRVDAGGDRGQG
ncbi:helix-turn-helix domain-containing protein [Actinomadura rugatobispora]|uniref:Helix-turn-helix domain-containing protein n=1 Tax=Actinomadura rugatobispora TaxID=1994 RepID=A0ABW1AFT8_9ACTN